MLCIHHVILVYMFENIIVNYRCFDWCFNKNST